MRINTDGNNINLIIKSDQWGRYLYIQKKDISEKPHTALSSIIELCLNESVQTYEEITYVRIEQPAAKIPTSKCPVNINGMLWMCNPHNKIRTPPNSILSPKMREGFLPIKSARKGREKSPMRQPIGKIDCAKRRSPSPSQ